MDNAELYWPGMPLLVQFYRHFPFLAASESFSQNVITTVNLLI